MLMVLFRSLRFKVSLLFVAIMVLLEIVLFSYNNYAIRIVRNQVAQSYMNLLPSIVGKMDDSLGEVRNYLIRTMNPNGDNADIVTFNLSEKESSEYYYSMANIFQKLGKDINYFGLSVESLFVYSQQNDELISFTSVFPDKETDYEKINLSLKELSRQAAREGTNSLWKVHKLDGNPGLVCIISNSAGCFIGARIDIRQLQIKDSTTNAGENNTVIMSGDGDILFSENKALSEKAVLSNSVADQKSAYQTISVPDYGKKYLVITQTAKNAGLIYVQMIDEQVIVKNFSFFQNMVILLPIGMLCILLLYFVLLHGILLSPMKEMVKGMKRIIQGDLEVSLDEKGPEEFRLVIQTFNKMVSRIMKLKINIYESELKTKNADLKAANADLKAANAELDARKAELRSLQMQINPHFFANSLNIVYNLAALNNVKAVQKMSIYLSNYFRYLLQAGNSMTELRHELDFIRNYLGIQKLRFTTRLDFDISVPEQYLDQMLPPLLIQPIVENAIIHGFRDKGQPLVINISAGADPAMPETGYRITIQDNGCGFAVADPFTLCGQADPEKDKGSHIGMHNVIDRLQMAFGDQAGIEAYNSADGGAVVRFRLPLNALPQQEVNE